MLIAGLILVIALIAIFALLMRQNKKGKTQNRREIPEEEIEIVELDETTPQVEKKDNVSDDTLDLDDLFKTMSIHVLKDDPNFDFGLQRKKD